MCRSPLTRLAVLHLPRRKEGRKEGMKETCEFVVYILFHVVILLSKICFIFLIVPYTLLCIELLTEHNNNVKNNDH
jgi:hypothetical protein